MGVKRLLFRVRDQFWLIPLLFAACAIAGGIGLTVLDDLINSSLKAPFLFQGGPEGARSVLSSIIQSMISFTGLVFSITIVALQLTSSQFSPRVLRTFLRDRLTRSALGTFVATFMYALVVLRSVRGVTGTNAAVPQIAVTFSVLLVMVSVLVFVVYIHHVAQSMRVATIIARIGQDTRRLIAKEYGPETQQDDPGRDGAGNSVDGHQIPLRLLSTRQGVVQRIDDAALAALARRHGARVRLLRATGEFVPCGSPLMDVLCREPDDLNEGRLREAVQMDSERSLDEDVGFGLRELVDIAERAISPAINDPTTAVQAIDQIHDLMRRLVTCRLVPRRRFDDDGRLLVEVPRPDIDDYLQLALQEPTRWGGDIARIRTRLQIMVDDLLGTARPEYRSRIAAAARQYGLQPAAEQTHPPLRPSDLGLR